MRDKIAMGALADSYYEYLLKQWLQSPSETHFKTRWLEVMSELPSMMYPYPEEDDKDNEDVVYRIIERQSDGSPLLKMDHLSCFTPGMVALGYSSVPAMADEKAHAGIQKLLTAEHDATEVVKAAKDEKVARLKQAKAEAEAEIAAYKAQRESQFQVFSKERMGDTGAHSKELAKQSEAELQSIVTQVSGNKKAVIDMLLKSVTTVS
jgi:V-type H+-transporting ATPase subunit G